MAKLTIPVAEVFSPLLQPSRYKGAWGGRSSGKSHFFAGLLIEDSLAEPGLLSVCIREVQKNLKDSAKRLLEKKIIEFGLGEAQGFKVFADVIRTPGDGIIIFMGMQDHTAESIKSLEGFNRAWIEEGQTLSAKSLSLLRPTIMRGDEDSQIWASWNPRLKNDAVDVMLRGPELPTGSIVVRANWQDNPWFSETSELERQDCLRQDPDQYEHTWDGDYVTVVVGAYYARQLAQARSEGRISRVGRDPLMSCWAFWDIGGTGAKADAAAIWIVQFIGKEVRFLDYYEARGQTLGTHLEWMRHRGYGRAECVLPHDGANANTIYDTSYENEIKKAGFSVRVIKNQGTGAAFGRIEASRRLFPQMWFDSERCAAGLAAVGWYHETIDEHRNIGLGPAHDWASHGADAFGSVAISYEQLNPIKTYSAPLVGAYTPLDDDIGY